MNSIRSYILHKEKENFLNCDDHFALDIDKLNFIVADGSSSDFFSKIYARVLCDTLKNDLSSIKNKEIIKKANESWREEVLNELKAANCRPGSFAYVHYQRRDPGCSTICGLHIDSNDKGPTFSIYVLGDSVLFFIPQGEALPTLQVSSDSNSNFSCDRQMKFGYAPVIASSYSDNWVDDVLVVKDRELTPGIFYLVTDATAEWILHYQEWSVEDIFKRIDSIKSQSEFEQFVKEIRSLGAHMDDMTLMRIQIDDIHNLSFDKNNIDCYDYRAEAKKIKELEQNTNSETTNTSNSDNLPISEEPSNERNSPSNQNVEKKLVEDNLKQLSEVKNNKPDETIEDLRRKNDELEKELSKKNKELEELKKKIKPKNAVSKKESCQSFLRKKSFLKKSKTSYQKKKNSKGREK